jgi:PAS domain S-box-containing protein
MMVRADRVEEARLARELAELARDLLGLAPGEIKHGLSRAIALLGRAGGADRANLVDLQSSSAEGTIAHRWAATERPLQSVEWPRDATRHPWIVAQLARGEWVDAPSVDELPDEAHDDRAALLARGVRAYLAIPIHTDDTFVAYVELERLEADGGWDESERTLLRIGAGIVAGAIRRLRFEDARSASDARLTTLASLASDAVSEFAWDGRVLYVSPSIFGILGYEPTDIENLNVLDLVHREDHPILNRALEEVRQRGASPSAELRAIHRDGSLRWLEAEGRPYETPSGEQRIVVIVRNITARVTSRNEIERRLEVESLVAQLSRDFIGRSSEEIDEGIEDALRVACKLGSADRGFLVSIPDTEGAGGVGSYEWVAKGVARHVPDAVSRNQTRHRWMRDRLLAGEIIVVPCLDEMPVDAAPERRSMRARGVQSCITIPVLSSGALIGVLGLECHFEEKSWSDSEQALLRLVAELFTSVLRRQANEELRARSQRALESQLDREKTVAQLSRRIFDLEPEQIVAAVRQSLPVLAELADAERIRLFAYESLDAIRPEIYEWWAESARLERTDAHAELKEDFPYAASLLDRGMIYHVPAVSALPEEAEAERRHMVTQRIRSMLAIPLDAERKVGGTLTVDCFSEEKTWSDEAITLLRLTGEILMGGLRRRRAALELRESQSLLMQSQKMEAVGTLAGGIAHDFNNQLAVMLGNARYVLDGFERSGAPDGAAEAAEALQDIERAAEHCARLTEGLLAFSRRSPMESRSLDLVSLGHEVRGLVEPLLPASIRLESDLDDFLYPVRADPTQLQQVLINLMVNARDAMPAGGRLRLAGRNITIGKDEAAALGLSAGGPAVELIVQDDGVGMSPDVASRVFEPFFTTKDVGRGTGLGLATAYGIIQRLGGCIQLESEEGVGSRFRLVVPASSVERPVGGAEDERLDARVVGRVLLVEDEPAVRRVVARMLESRGIKVIEATDGRDGLRVGRSSLESPDLLITDITMPVMSGAELARTLTEERPDLPVLFLSGYSDGLVGQVSSELSRARFLQKPFAEDALIRAVHSLLEHAPEA